MEQKQNEQIMKDMIAALPSFWAKFNKLKLPNGPFSFEGHEYLIRPLTQVMRRVRVIRKASQGGFSVAETIDDLHGCIYNRFPQGVGYFMPTDTEVQKFSKTKFAPLIRENACVGQYVKSGGKGGTDSADLKKVGNSYIHFVSTTLNRSIEGEMDTASILSFSCDKIVFDELDRMNQSVIEKARARYGHSKIKQERFLSNPTAENYGIDAMFQESDQSYWHRLCPHCLKYTCPDLEFLRDPEKLIRRLADGQGVFLCAHCQEPLPLYYRDSKTGKESDYVPMYPGREIEGIHWSQLNSAFHDPVELLKVFRNPPEGNFKDVSRFRFGMPYTAKEDQLRPNDVRSCCGNEPMVFSHQGPCVMGLDVMNKIHLLIGFRCGIDSYEVIKSATVSEFKEAYDLARKYNVKAAGIDVLPDIHSAKEFQKNLRSIGCKAYLVDYRASRSVGAYGVDEKNMIIKANRTEAMDMTHNMIIERKIVLPRMEQCEELIKQICNPFKQQFANEKTGQPEYRYVGKVDHFRHALNYLILAGLCGKVNRVLPFNQKPKTADCDSSYKVI